MALAAFAANSLLCRAALASRSIDSGSFTFVRIAVGAVVLLAIARLRPARGRHAPTAWRATPAVALFVYAFAFSQAYVRLATGAGALLLFGAVQLTMIAAGLRAGERPRHRAWLGIALAVSGLVGLTFPGLHSPDAFGSGLMAIAGLAWGIYSLIGRSALDPVGMTARNFALATPLAALAWAGAASTGSVHAAPRGVLLAAASGALASGVGYAVWYAALRGLTRTRAAVVQLAVPVLAAVAAVLILGEPVALRLALAGVAILGGIAVVLRSQ